MTQVAIRSTHIIAAEINSIKEQTRKMVLHNSIEIGRRLVEAKSMLAHGEWGDWLKDSVDYSQSTANNLMKIFEQYGADQLTLFGSEAKSQALGNLSYTQAVALLGVPEEQREEFIQQNDIENMSTRELQQAIKEKQTLEQKLKEAEAAAEKERQARQLLAQKQEVQEKKAKEHDELVKRLNREIEEAKATGNDEEVENLQASLNSSESALEASRKRIKELEDELKKKPIDVPAVVEKVPAAIEAELAELRHKVSQQADKNVVKFSVCFESLVKGFQDLLGSLAAIEDPESHEKYKNAVKGLIGKMSDRL